MRFVPAIVALLISISLCAASALAADLTTNGGVELAAKAVDSTMGDNIVYISVLNRLSVDCDCDGNPSEPDMHDIGILASTDPLAVDQAAIDLVYAMPDSGSLIERIESRNGLHTLDAAEAIGLGSRAYNLVVIE
jgi:uncharacterized Fe-S center protein